MPTGDSIEKAQLRMALDKCKALERELKRMRAVSTAAQTLADVMETCHECKGTVLVEENPVHCENCSAYCEDHEGSECATIYGLHLELKKQLARATPPAEPPAQEGSDASNS